MDGARTPVTLHDARLMLVEGKFRMVSRNGGRSKRGRCKTQLSQYSIQIRGRRWICIRGPCLCSPRFLAPCIVGDPLD
jgi:hypothetical protein